MHQLSICFQITLLLVCFASATLRAEEPPQVSPNSSRSLEFRIRGNIAPNWLDAGKLWYSTTNSKGESEFVFVDSNSSSVSRAPNLAELAKLAQLDFTSQEGGTILPSLAEDNQPAVATFQNDTSAEIRLYWLDSNSRSRLYHTLAPGARVTQNTFTGHSWFAVDGDNKPIWTTRISMAAPELVITAQQIAEPFPRLPGMRSRRTETRTNPNNKFAVEMVDYDIQFKPSDLNESFSTKDIEGIQGTKENSYIPDVIWSPNSRYAIAQQIAQGDRRELTLLESSPKDQLQPKVKQSRYDKPGDQLDKPILRLIDLSTRQNIPIDDSLFPTPWSIEEVRWEPDSSSFTFLYNQRGHQLLRLIRVHAATGKSSIVFEEKSDTFVDYAHKAFRKYLDSSNELIWASERDGWYHLYLVDLNTGALKNQITRGEWVVRSIEHIDETTRQIWFYAGGIAAGQDPYYRHLCRVNFDGSGLIQLTQGDGDHTCQLSPDKKLFVDKYSRVDMPPVFELRSGETGALIVTLESNNIDDLIASGWHSPERFVAKGRDGTTDIYGLIVRPSNFDPKLKYPIIESIYAGPQDSFVPKSFTVLSELTQLADKGFIVVKIDGMGTSNRSKKFHDVSYRNLADGGFPDRKLWITEAAKRYPEMDASRVGVYGGSAGGQNALAALLFHGDFYKAAVADCGCHDNRMDKVWWNELYMGWPIGPHYEANSNVTNAHRLQGKLFLMVGELDSNVDPASTYQVVNALIQADKDFELLVFPGGGHGAGSSPYGKRRRDDFFIRSLGTPN